MCQIQRLVSKVDNDTGNSPAIFGHRGSGSSQNNVKDLSVERYRSCGNLFSSITNRAANALHKEKRFPSTSNRQTILLKG